MKDSFNVDSSTIQNVFLPTLTQVRLAAEGAARKFSQKNPALLTFPEHQSKSQPRELEKTALSLRTLSDLL
jgi:hypothetical protein